MDQANATVRKSRRQAGQEPEFDILPGRRHQRKEDLEEAAGTLAAEHSVNRSGRNAPPGAVSVKTGSSSVKSTASRLLTKRLEVELQAEEELLKMEEEVLQRRRKVAEKKLALQQARIDEEEEDSQESSGDEYGTVWDGQGEDGQNSRVEDWVSNQVENPPRIPTPEPKPAPSEGSGGAIDIMANAIAALAQFQANNAQSGDMKSFITRQTVGKELTQFSGEADEWPAFIEEYQSTTEMCKFSDAENLRRLRKCLKGKAKETVQSMLTIPENVAKVMKALEMNFGQPRLIIQSLVTKVRSLPALKDEKPHLTIDLANSVRNLVASMTSLQSKGHMANPQLMDELAAKLPASMRGSWAREIIEKKSEADLSHFSSWLDKRAEEANLYRNLTVEKSEVFRDSRSRQMKTRREGVFTINEEKSDHSESPFCLFCRKKFHFIGDCRNFASKDSKTKLDFVKEKRLCFRCLRTGHIFSKCQMTQSCGKDGCQKGHHRSLIYEKQKEPEEQQEEKKLETVNTNYHEEGQVLLCVLPVTLSGPKGQIETFAMLDTASTVTMISEEAASALKLEGPKRELNLNWMDSTSKREKDVMNVALNISGADRNVKYSLSDVKVKKDLKLRIQSLDMSKLTRKWKHLASVNVASYRYAKPHILIGQDHNQFLRLCETIEGPANAPCASRTKLGWVVHGKDSSLRNGVEKDFALHISHQEKRDEALHGLVKEFFKTETFGVNLKAEKPRSKEDVRARQIMDKSIVRVDDRWETSLLWRTDEVKLPQSKATAEHRLRGLERKMDRDKIFADNYCQIILDYEKKGYARKLSAEEAKIHTNRTWYLPHFGVTNPNKPDKIRPVFDAAARSYGISLNDELLTGPDLMSSLVGVLLKFRERKIGFSGDIAEMFHQIRVKIEDRCAQRFLWRGLNRNVPPDVWEMKVMTFGAARSPSLAQEVKNKNAEEFRHEFPKAVDAIIHQHYVDDYLDSVDDEEGAIQLIRDVTEVHKRGGFKITKWICNSQDVLKEIGAAPKTESGKPAEIKNLSLESEFKIERVLGLRWNPILDVFEFATSFSRVDQAIVTGSRIPTKREMLRLVMSIFDPIGFLSPFIVRAKILLQEVWRAGVNWDDPITDTLNEKWQSWVRNLQEIGDVKIPRCYSQWMKYVKSIQLHVFVDASSQAFAAVAYLRVDVGGPIEIKISAAKSGVAPLKPISIPRLELQAAVMGSRLATMLKEEHRIKIDAVHYWSDSRTVLCWIRSDARKYKPFVSHRIGEILEASEVCEWHWVPTEENVADEATRDCQGNDLKEGCRWINGPKFLYQSKDWWPKEKERTAEVDASISNTGGVLEELKPSEFVHVVTEFEDWMKNYVSSFSSWPRLVRITAWFLRYRKNRNVKAASRNLKKFLTPDECEKAEMLLTRYSQGWSFPSELNKLAEGNPISKRSRLATFKIFLDDRKIMRMSGRTVKSPELSFEARQPIVLDPKDHYTRLLIQHYHAKAGHHGQEAVINQLKQKYWILKMRSAVKSVWSNCQECKISRATPTNPEMGALPEIRVTRPERPFAATGVDYFGPMEITVGRRREKRYGVLFTCLATRAVHLELAASLTTDSCIMAVRRMIGRRGCPFRMYSDNGTNFRGADAELRKSIQELDERKIMDDLTPRGIEWHFIPPSAPHMGGAWERLVRSLKTALKATLKERAPKEETLQTLLVEAESLVNSRPLTHVSLDPEDEPALTPYNFLIGTSTVAAAPGTFSDDEFYLRKQWRISQRLADMFWKRWVNEYLPSLNRREKWNQPTEQVKVGDLVVIADGNLERGSWPRGKVIAVYPGKDGVVRVAEVQTNTGVYRRPVCKICVLDVAEEVDRTSSTTGGSMCPGESQTSVGEGGNPNLGGKEGKKGEEKSKQSHLPTREGRSKTQAERDHEARGK